MKLTCEYCEKELEVPDDEEKFRCPHCGCPHDLRDCPTCYYGYEEDGEGE